MKKILAALCVCAVALILGACGSKNTPSATAEAYADYIIKGDYKSAIELIQFKGSEEQVEKQKEFYLQMLENKVKDGLPDDKKMTKFEVINEEIDEENGKATVTANVTYANDTTKEETTKLVKTEDGKWMIDGEK
ncbi:MAG: DUF4878 domain-containing protein [Bacteroidaceae bacterium]|nr:DUF4878 domain-containing protein [Bacteroidaceae bacterium]